MMPPRCDVPFVLEVDEIYNLACPASPIHYQYDPVQTTKTSVHGAINMLGLAKRVKAKICRRQHPRSTVTPKFIRRQKSTGAGSIRSAYGHVTMKANGALRRYSLIIGVSTSSDQGRRIFNTYGPRMHPHDGRVVSNFIVQALAGEDITIYGDGTQSRSFCYVDDLIEAMIRAMNTPDDFTGPINIGNPTEFTITELAERVLELTGSRSKLVYRPLPSDDPRQRQPDISLARSMLDWSPKVALRDGLEKTVAYFRAAASGPALPTSSLSRQLRAAS